MEPSGFQILYESGPCLVLGKPAGLLTQAPPGIDSLELRLRRYLQQREGKSHALYLGLPHRLDRPVSGAIVFARHVRAAQRIARQFEARTVDKFYWALIEGGPFGDEPAGAASLDDAGAAGAPGRRPGMADAGTWTDWMRKVPDEPRSETVPADHPDAQRAVLHYQVRGATASTVWLEIRLETGRTHQIRVQCAARGTPIVGDSAYGARRPFGPSSDDLRARWIALHARYLAFEHPMTRERVEVEAPLEAAWTHDGLPGGSSSGADAGPPGV